MGLKARQLTHRSMDVIVYLTYSSRERENQENRLHKSGDFALISPRRKAVTKTVIGNVFL